MKGSNLFYSTLLTLTFLFFPGNPFSSHSIRIVSSQRPSPRISSRLALSICNQRLEFQASGVIQRPVKSARPLNGQGQAVPCGWINWRVGPSHPDTYKTCHQIERPTERIAGGQDAKPGQFPFIVTLGIGRSIILCGGSIISEQWVLTAGKCSGGPTGPTDTAVAGDHQLSVEDGTEQVRRVVKRLFQPPPFNSTETQDDHEIVMFKVDPPFIFNDHVQPVALPPRGFDPEGIVTIAGWGNTRRPSDPRLSDILQFTQVPVIPRKKCQEQIKKIDPYIEIDESDVCVGWDDGRANSCFGDQGSPMVTTIDGKVTILGEAVGISSQECKLPEHPNWYKRVSYPYYLDYIAKSIAEN